MSGVRHMLQQRMPDETVLLRHSAWAECPHASVHETAASSSKHIGQLMCKKWEIAGITGISAKLEKDTKMETRRAKRSRSEIQPEAEECCVCMDAPAEILQRECGHAVLCVKCAFRVQFGVHRACPMCRAPALCPFVPAKTYTVRKLDASSGFEAMAFAQSSIMHISQSRPGKSHDAMIRSLEGILPLMPDDCSRCVLVVEYYGLNGD